MTSSTDKFEFKEGGEGGTPSAEERDLNEPSILYKVLKTISIVIVWMAIGLWSEVNGATFQDLMFKNSATYASMSNAISMRGAGGLAGSILGGGLLVDRFHSKAELILAICVAVCAVLNAIVPYSQWIELLFALFLLEGWLEVIINVAGQVVIMDIWKDKANGPLHLIHLGYGAGSFIVPQLVAPFISDVLPTEEEAITNPACDLTSEELSLNSTNITTVAPEPSDNLATGFWIVSACIAAISALWFGYFFFDKRKAENGAASQAKDLKIKQIFNPNTCSPGHPVYAILLYILMFMWIYSAVAGERIYAKYLYSYGRQQACLSKQEAANILTAFWLSFTAGRFGGFMVTNFIPMKIFIFIEGLGSLAAGLVLFFFGSNKTVLWASVCVAGIFIGPCYPSGLAWANRYMTVTAVGVTVLSIGAGVSDLTFLPAVGSTVDSVGISAMTAFALGFGVVCAALPIAMQGVACTRGDRFEREEAEEDGTQQSSH